MPNSNANSADPVQTPLFLNVPFIGHYRHKGVYAGTSIRTGAPVTQLVKRCLLI